MPRAPRFDEPYGYYHVTQDGNGDASLFVDDEDRAYFLSFLGRVALRDSWRCFSYCVLSKHFHVVLQTASVRLGRSMQWLNGTYARSFNGRHECSGHVFGGRYRTTFIRDERHLVEACRYVDLNPVRAGLCAHPREWPWSSYRALAGLAPHPPFLSRRAAELVGGNWAAFVEEGLTL